MQDEQADMIGISENAVLALRAASRRDMANPCGELMRTATDECLPRYSGPGTNIPLAVHWHTNPFNST